MGKNLNGLNLVEVYLYNILEELTKVLMPSMIAVTDKDCPNLISASAEVPMSSFKKISISRGMRWSK